MANVTLKNIRKTYGDGIVAVDDFNLEVADQEFLILVGPSGCGKTTTLRMIAGLEEITSGELYIDGELVNDVRPVDRDIAMVFQNYALYPHMNVYDNMAFGLKMRRVPKGEIDARVCEVAETLGLTPCLNRKPKALSGGQKQRVAMGRAIVRQPKVFLMDEPLSNLDAKLRGQMRMELARLHQSLKATIIYVTHDQIEAMTLGTRIVVMKDGVIQQIDSPRNLYHMPDNMFVAGFIGAPQINFVNVRCEEAGGDVRVRLGEACCAVPDEVAVLLRERGYCGEGLVVGVRPEDVIVDGESGVTDALILHAAVRLDEMLGGESYLHLALAGQEIVAKKKCDVCYEVGREVSIGLPAVKMHFFDPQSQRAIRR